MYATNTTSTSYIPTSNTVEDVDINNPFAHLDALEALNGRTVEQKTTSVGRIDNHNWNSIYDWYCENVSLYPRTIETSRSEDIQRLIHIFTIDNITTELIRFRLNQIIIKNDTSEKQSALKIIEFIKLINSCEIRPLVLLESTTPAHPILKEFLKLKTISLKLESTDSQ